MQELLDYWLEEPPAHVLLAMRYLGETKSRKRQITQEQAETEMAQLSGFLGGAPQKLPPHLRKLVMDAEQMKQQHKGI